MASEAEYAARYAAEQEAKYAARYAAEKAAVSPAPTSPPKRNMFEQTGDLIQRHVTGPIRNAAESVIEPIASIGSSLVAQPVAGAIGAGREILTRDFEKGTGERTAKAVMDRLSYSPRNPNAQSALQTVGKAFEESKLAGLPMVGQELPQIARAAAQQAPLTRSAIDSVVATQVGKRAAQAEAAAEKSRAIAPKIEVTNKARELGIKLDPSEVKNTTKNAVVTATAGKENIQKHAAVQNQQTVNAKLAKDIGVPENTPLKEEAFNAVREKAAKPYGEIEKIKGFTADKQFFDDIDNINRLEGLTPEEAAYLKAKAPEIQAQIRQIGENGFSGQGVVTLMKDLRNEANMVLNKQGVVDPAIIAAAEAKRAAAKAIEGLVDRQLVSMDKTNPGKGYGDLADRFREGRALIAKSHTIQKATNLVTGDVDAVKLGEIAKKSTHLTGALKDISEVAAAYPSVMTTATKVGDPTPSFNVQGYGIPGVIGAGAGSAIGGPVGGMVGAGLGIVARPLIRNAAKNKALSEAYQARNATLPDARPMRERLGYERAMPEGPEPVVAPEEPRPLPYLKDAPPVLMAEEVAKRNEDLPVFSEELLPIAERYQGTNIPIGTIEAGGPAVSRTPLPTLPPQGRGLLSLEDAQANVVRSRSIPEQGVDFMGKTEFWQQPVMKQATEAFIRRAEELRTIINNKYPIDGRKQAAAALELQALEKEFGAGAKLGGLRGPSDAYSALYQAGGETQLPIEKTFDPRITEAILGRRKQ